ncbi:hypothetical protein ACMXYX_18185 (plasmid) [Neptuniibacter sp. QD72_48]|uniref:hypothetical protein n=1 Tax=Neptuniibacter sp. QD72_48 TaxID=3398214 RepID=UPI0039F4B032
MKNFINPLTIKFLNDLTTFQRQVVGLLAMTAYFAGVFSLAWLFGGSIFEVIADLTDGDIRDVMSGAFLGGLVFAGLIKFAQMQFEWAKFHFVRFTSEEIVEETKVAEIAEEITPPTAGAVNLNKGISLSKSCESQGCLHSKAKQRTDLAWNHFRKRKAKGETDAVRPQKEDYAYAAAVLARADLIEQDVDDALHAANVLAGA